MNIETQKRISQNLKIIRISHCLNQSQMAELVGVSRSAYISYENGKRTPDAEVLFNIATRFGLNMSVFFEHDYYRLLNHIENGELYDDGLVKLIKSYKDLSSFSKGMLIERAECLKEWDKMREDKRKILEENKLKK
ncbi:MAG: helix-turn-helix transcriptional regulator [Firmicutes bacterium]|jgi:transcriptional regulator with XRE-family HTH domain|nr:helix-turn-helix transcriptional regulator [Bacillota bacterium]